MKSRFFFLSLLFLLFFVVRMNGQAPAYGYYEPFDSTFPAIGWSTPTSDWNWSSTTGPAGSPVAIVSPSGAGVAVMNDTSLDTTANELVSPTFAINTFDSVRLRFNQILSGFEVSSDTAYLEIKTNLGTTTVPLKLDSNWNGTTVPWNLQDIDLTSVTTGADSVNISFISSTVDAVWIIDDFHLYDPDDQGDVVPISYLGDSLREFNIPFDLGDDDWPYVPNQLVVDFAPGVPEARRQEIRDSFGFRKIMTCHCSSEIELWVEDGDAMDPNIIGIQEKAKGSGSSSDVDNVEFNKYNFNSLFETTPGPTDSLVVMPEGIRDTPKKAVLISILDTGVDYTHPDLVDQIWKNPDLKRPDSCSVDTDFIGWNFVHDNNNPMDDHSHGTHVAGIIVDNLKKNCSGPCDYRIIPLKTHNANGVATLFNVTCATYYSIDADVDIINDSWGYYGKSSRILKTAMQNAESQNILIVSSAGNDTIDLDDTPQFPACDTVANIVTVGSHDKVVNGVYQRSVFSNHSSREVDLLALGDQVVSAYPGNMRIAKSGTSMSAPAVTAAYVQYYCAKRKDVKTIKESLLSCVRKEPSMVGKEVVEGRVLDFDYRCFIWYKYKWWIIGFVVLILLLTYSSICWRRSRTFYSLRKREK